MKQYKELTLSDADEFYAFVEQFRCYSDLSFVSLICWSNQVLFNLGQNNLSVIFEDYESNHKIITGIANGENDTFISQLIDEASESKLLLLDAVPGDVIESLNNSDLKSCFIHSDDQSDYLYKPQSQLNLEGSIYSWYRRKLAIFLRKTADLSVDVTVNANAQTLDLPAYDLIWQDWSTKINHKEAAALHRYITLFPELRNQSIVTIRINGEIKAFAFVEAIFCTEKTLLIHFFKSSKDFEGLANYLFQEIAKHADEIDAKWINFEQDVGEEGLRQYKQKLCPDTMLEKYTYNRF